MRMFRTAGLGLGLLAVAALGGCSELDKVTGLDTSSLTTQQKVTLAAEVVNGVCVLTAAGLAFAGGVNSIVHPNASTGGSGQSATGTITKASAIDAAGCAALNGATATLIGTTSSGTAAVQVAK